jgi:hypothetical protein
MREVLGVLLMEEENGSIAVQLFAEPDRAMDSFKNLTGRIGQKPQRATFLKITYDTDTMEISLPHGTLTQGKKPVEMLVKDLPVPEPEKVEAYRLGEGPIKLSKEEVHEPKQR